MRKFYSRCYLYNKQSIIVGILQYTDFNCTEVQYGTLGIVSDPNAQFFTVYIIDSYESFITSSQLDTIRINTPLKTNSAAGNFSEFIIYYDNANLFVSTDISQDVNLSKPFVKVAEDNSLLVEDLSGDYVSDCSPGNSEAGKLGQDGDGFFIIKL